jgi:hypothetical protein
MKFIEYALSGLAITAAVVVCVLKLEDNNKVRRRVSKYNDIDSTDSTDITVPVTTQKQHILTLHYQMRAWGHKDYILHFYNDGTFYFIDHALAGGTIITERLNSQQQSALNYVIGNFDELIRSKDKINLHYLDDSHTYITMNEYRIDLGLNEKNVFSSDLDTHLHILTAMLHHYDNKT